eukprot:TRINITY_DN2403_c0_g1_i3.p1 TRINITY_DN2403_c0_g1~~TRINITY_DN2403_c0_g1_i3.p1  ORF type:complete len:473 (-),score=72.62 TRINITY_DN2403_c0_g1_i3:104-1522(-)
MNQILLKLTVSVVSATDELQLVYHCLKLGAADFLTKPIHVKEVENIWQTIWRKNREEENKENQEKVQQEMELKVNEAVSTPIKAIAEYVSQLLSSGDITPETRDALSEILNTLHKSQFYRPAIESYIRSKDIDSETKRWFANELHLASLVRTQALPSAPVQVIDSEITQKLRSYDFDVWTIQDDATFFSMVTGMFNDFGLLDTFKIDQVQFLAFLQVIKSNYSDSNPYHNFRHAFDVLHTSYLMLTNCKASAYLTPLEILTVMFSGLLHDVGHTGTSNRFHIETYSDLAVKYNDQSVLENHHCSLGWKLLMKYKILDNIPKDDMRKIRSYFIQLVLATDLSKHFDEMAIFENLKGETLDRDNEEHRKLISKMIMKCADLSNPTKPFTVARYWALMIQEEFFQQGDKEKSLELPYSPFSERGNSSLPQMQVNFADFIVIPLFKAVSSFLPLLEEAIIPQLLENRAKWAALKEG